MIGANTPLSPQVSVFHSDCHIDEDPIFPACNVQNKDEEIVAQPFVSSILVERDLERENIINQEYFKIITSSEYNENPIAYVQRMILQRQQENDRWKFPDDDVLKKLKNLLDL